MSLPLLASELVPAHRLTRIIRRLDGDEVEAELLHDTEGSVVRAEAPREDEVEPHAFEPVGEELAGGRGRIAVTPVGPADPVTELRAGGRLFDAGERGDAEEAIVLADGEGLAGTARAQPLRPLDEGQETRAGVESRQGHARDGLLGDERPEIADVPPAHGDEQ